MDQKELQAPWLAHMDQIPATLSYFEGSMVEAVEKIAAEYPRYPAMTFMGRTTTYQKTIAMIRRCAASLQALGIKEGDRVTLALPNCPQAIFLFYAINMAGGIANMIHPLSAEKEIEFYLKESDSVAAVTLDQFYDKFAAIRQNTHLKHLILASIQDALSPLKAFAYGLAQGRSRPKIPTDAPVLFWNEFLKFGGSGAPCRINRPSDREAVILYSGGTTGTTKGILLSNKNFNALGQQVVAANPNFCIGDKMLAAMPIFHGFGLGVCIHTMLSQGGHCILVPRFSPKSYAKDLMHHRCNFIAGVPTLYEALLRISALKGKKLPFLKGVFSGGDSLSVELKKKLDCFLEEHSAPVRVREGYGTTETVTACCLTPAHLSKEGSIGIPFPDTFIKIVAPNTDRALPFGQEGEILLAGPTVMMGYLDRPEETAQALRTHSDGMQWVYTGDLGIMDEDGFLYFKGRAKRMIISSGYNIYPAQLENILDAHPLVQMSCIIGVADPIKMQKVKAFIQLKPEIAADAQTKAILMDYCKKNIAKYALPYDIEFKEELPKTLVGKVAYRILEENENKKEQ